MKYIYLVSRVSKCDYDEYDSFVCVHESEKEAKKLANEFEGMSYKDSVVLKIGVANGNLEVGHIVCSSFNAG